MSEEFMMVGCSQRWRGEKVYMDTPFSGRKPIEERGQRCLSLETDRKKARQA